MKPAVSIIVCTLNREEVLCGTLRAVAALIKGRDDTEIIVVDQTRNHAKNTEDCLADLEDLIQLHRVEFASLTKARNYGIRHARGEIILFLDDDIDPSPRLIDEHLVRYTDPAIWAVGGSTLLPGKRQLSKQELSNNELKVLEKGQMNRFDLDWPRRMNWAPGCNMSFRRDRLFEVGGFDEAFYGMAIGEEAELCHRIIRTGGIIAYNPKALLVHLVAFTGGCRDARLEAERTAQLIDNSLYFYKRTGVSGHIIFSRILSQCLTIIFNRASLRAGSWVGKAVDCWRAINRALDNVGRPARLGLSAEDNV